ncbi:hypothetical protein BH10BAC6_BH10BAC6_00610 [soil metagenome]
MKRIERNPLFGLGFVREAWPEFAFSILMVLPAVAVSTLVIMKLGWHSSQATTGYSMAALFAMAHYAKEDRTWFSYVVRGVVYISSIVLAVLVDTQIYMGLLPHMHMLAAMTIALLVGMELVTVLLYVTTERTPKRYFYGSMLLSVPAMALVFALLTWLFSLNGVTTGM